MENTVPNFSIDLTGQVALVTGASQVWDIGLQKY